MSFITDYDFRSAIRSYQINEIVEGDHTLIDIAINNAIAEMKPYLFRYDVDLIFSQQGDKRDSLLVRFAVDIAIYELICIARPDQDADSREFRYKRAIDWLKQVRDERIPCALPLLKDEQQSGALLVEQSSNPKRNNYY